MIKILCQVPPILIGYYLPHKPNYVSKKKDRKVSIDVRKNQIHIYEQEECIHDRGKNEENDTNG